MADLEGANVKAQRLEQVRNALGLRKNKLAEVIGSEQSHVSKVLSGRVNLGKHLNDQIIRVLNLNPVWWETGVGEMFLQNEDFQSGSISLNKKENQHINNARILSVDQEDLYIMLPFVAVRARASYIEMGAPEKDFGTGKERPVIKWAGEDYKNNILIEIDGDSMEPNYRSGATVRAKYVPASDWEYMPGGVYAVTYANFFVVKRIVSNTIASTGKLTLTSDNPAGGIIEVPTDQIHNIWRVVEIVSAKAI